MTNEEKRENWKTRMTDKEESERQDSEIGTKREMLMKVKVERS